MASFPTAFHREGSRRQPWELPHPWDGKSAAAVCGGYE